MSPTDPELQQWRRDLDSARGARDPDLAVSLRMRDPGLSTPEARHRATIEERDWWLLNDREALERANEDSLGDRMDAALTLYRWGTKPGCPFTPAELHLLSTILLQWLTLVEGPPVSLNEQTVARVKAIQRKAIESASTASSR